MSNTAPKGIIPDSVKWSFYIGGFAFLIAVLWTVFRYFEYSPEELASFSESEENNNENIEISESSKKSKMLLVLSCSLRLIPYYPVHYLLIK